MWISTVCLQLFFGAILVTANLPKDLQDPVLFCEGCYGTMYEIDNIMIELKHLKLVERVREAMDKVCSTDLLRKYVFSPPKMSKVSKVQFIYKTHF